MKRAIFVSAVAAALCWATAGCGSKASSSGAVNPSDLGLKDIPKMSGGSAPELEIMRMPTPQQKADYLRSLAKDSNFDPKKHQEWLEEYSKNEDPDVAAAAKELLDKAK